MDQSCLSVAERVVEHMKVIIKLTGSHGNVTELYRGNEIETRSYDTRLAVSDSTIIIDLKKLEDAEKIIVVIER